MRDILYLMDLMQLKMPPDVVRAIANAIERDIEINRVGIESMQLGESLTYLRYRIALWDARHSTDPTA